MSTVTEIWLPVAGYEGFYEVSNQGRVRSIDRVIELSSGYSSTRRVRGRVLGQKTRNGAHMFVDLSKHNSVQRKWVHRLVLEAFVRPRRPGEIARHLDGNARNNSVENLAWGTFSENTADSVEHGTHYHASRSHCPRGHVLLEPNLVEGIKRDGRRSCKACNRAHSYIYRNRHLDFQSVSDKYFEEIMEEN